MTTWKRWQDYATMVFGVLLFISPFVFGETETVYADCPAMTPGCASETFACSPSLASAEDISSSVGAGEAASVPELDGKVTS